MSKSAGKKALFEKGLNQLEADILRIVWNENGATVRQIHEELLKNGYVPYTTIMAAVQNLTKKEILKQKKQSRANTYIATISARETAIQLINDVIDKLLEGNSDFVLKYLLQLKSDSELDQIKNLKNQL